MGLAAASMFAAGVQQYGFGVLAPPLAAAHGWTFAQVVLSLALWAICQASVAFPAAWLRDRGLLPPAVAMAGGAVLCAAGLVTLGHASSLTAVFVGYSVLGGLGTGLVYATCVGAVLAWFPDRAPAWTGLVSGAFAAGSVPFVVLAAVWPGDRAVLLDVTAAVVLLMIAGCGLLLRFPPRNWWPPAPDPRAWALERARTPDRPAIRAYGPRELFGCVVTRALYAVVALAAAVLLFDLAYLVTFVAGRGGGMGLAAAALAVLAGTTGGGRVLLGRFTDRLGRRRILRLALVTGGFAQFVLFYSGQHQHAVGILLGVALAGLGNGCCYTLLVGIVREYFGEAQAAQNFGVLYSAKAAGAVLGAVLAGFATHGALGAFVTAGVLSLAGALLAGRLTQPGRPQSLLPTGHIGQLPGRISVETHESGL